MEEARQLAEDLGTAVHLTSDFVRPGSEADLRHIEAAQAVSSALASRLEDVELNGTSVGDVLSRIFEGAIRQEAEIATALSGLAEETGPDFVICRGTGTSTGDAAIAWLASGRSEADGSDQSALQESCRQFIRHQLSLPAGTKGFTAAALGTHKWTAGGDLSGLCESSPVLFFVNHLAPLQQRHAVPIYEALVAEGKEVVVASAALLKRLDGAFAGARHVQLLDGSSLSMDEAVAGISSAFRRASANVAVEQGLLTRLALYIAVRNEEHLKRRVQMIASRVLGARELIEKIKPVSVWSPDVQSVEGGSVVAAAWGKAPVFTMHAAATSANPRLLPVVEHRAIHLSYGAQQSRSYAARSQRAPLELKVGSPHLDVLVQRSSKEHRKAARAKLELETGARYLFILAPKEEPILAPELLEQIRNWLETSGWRALYVTEQPLTSAQKDLLEPLLAGTRMEAADSGFLYEHLEAADAFVVGPSDLAVQAASTGKPTIRAPLPNSMRIYDDIAISGGAHAWDKGSSFSELMASAISPTKAHALDRDRFFSDYNCSRDAGSAAASALALGWPELGVADLAAHLTSVQEARRASKVWKPAGWRDPAAEKVSAPRIRDTFGHVMGHVVKSCQGWLAAFSVVGLANAATQLAAILLIVAFASALAGEGSFAAFGQEFSVPITTTTVRLGVLGVAAALAFAAVLGYFSAVMSANARKALFADAIRRTLDKLQEERAGSSMANIDAGGLPRILRREARYLSRSYVIILSAAPAAVTFVAVSVFVVATIPGVSALLLAILGASVPAYLLLSRKGAKISARLLDSAAMKARDDEWAITSITRNPLRDGLSAEDVGNYPQRSSVQAFLDAYRDRMVFGAWGTLTGSITGAVALTVFIAILLLAPAAEALGVADIALAVLAFRVLFQNSGTLLSAGTLVASYHPFVSKLTTFLSGQDRVEVGEGRVSTPSVPRSIIFDGAKLSIFSARKWVELLSLDGPTALVSGDYALADEDPYLALGISPQSMPGWVTSLSTENRAELTEFLALEKADASDWKKLPAAIKLFASVDTALQNRCHALVGSGRDFALLDQVERANLLVACLEQHLLLHFETAPSALDWENSFGLYVASHSRARFVGDIRSFAQNRLAIEDALRGASAADLEEAESLAA